MNKPKELYVWANNDKTISVSLGTAETEVKMTLEEAKQKFLGAIHAAEEIASPEKKELIEALQKIVEYGEAGGATTDSRLATIRHLAKSTLQSYQQKTK
jgi:hypothetical protein